MTRQLKVFLAVALVGLLASNVQAAVISVQPTVAGYFDSAFNPIPAPVGSPGSPVVVQLDVYMEVLSLLPGEDSFGTAAFSFRVDSDCPELGGVCVADVDAGGWAANQLGNTDTNGASPGGVLPVIAGNADLGTDSQDLQGILVQMATGAFTNAVDQRRRLGEAGSSSAFPVPLLLGSAFMEWNGLGQVKIGLSPIQVSAKLTNGQFVTALAPESAIITLGQCIPEPSSLVLLGSCFAGLAFRRRSA